MNEILLMRSTYSGHLGGTVQASGKTDSCQSEEGGYDELVTAPLEVLWGVDVALLAFTKQSGSC